MMKKFTIRMWTFLMFMTLSASLAWAQPTNTEINTVNQFIATFDVTPSHDVMNTAVGFMQGEVFDNGAPWSTLSIIIRFGESGEIDANNGNGDGSGTYMAENTIVYVIDTKYFIRVEVDVDAKTWSAWVTPDGGTETILATDYGFRASYDVLDNLFTYNVAAANGGVDDRTLNLSNVYYTPKATAINLVSTMPVMDGNISDGYWDNVEAYSCSSPYGNPLTGPEDLSGYWKAVWTADSLFIMGHVMDNDLNDNGVPTWNTDGFHLYFDLSNTRDGTGAGVAGNSKVFNQIYYAADGSQPTGGEDVVGTHFLMANDTGYVVEVSYAWTDLDAAGIGFTPETGAKIILDADLVDYDGSSFPKQLYWSSNDNCWANMDYAGQVELTELDVTELVAARDSLQTLVDNAVVGQENGEYLQAVLDAANTAIVSADDVINNAVSQIDVNNEVIAVYSAITAFQPLDYPTAVIKTVASENIPVIDGDISDRYWNNVDANYCEVYLPVQGDNTAFGYWKAVWDADSLYVMGFVNDTSLNDNGAPDWYTDGFHLYFDLSDFRDGTGAGSSTSKVFNQIYYAADGSQPTGGENVVGSHYLTANDTGYVVEASYAWSVMDMGGTGFIAAASEKLLMDVDLVSYNADWAPYENYWGSSQNCWSNMDDAGRIELGADVHTPLDFSALEVAIADAQATVDAQAGNIGDASGQYSQATVDAALVAIAAAQDVYDNAVTQQEIDDAVTALEDAMLLFVPNTSSVNDILNAGFSMYPNPVKGELNLDNISNVRTISIHTITGKTIKTYTNSQNSCSISLSELNKGMYIIEFTTINGMETRRFIKE